MKKYSIIILLAVLTIPTVFSFKKEKKKDIGLQLWSVQDSMKKDPRGTITQLGNMGFTFVEAADYEDGRFYGMDPVEFKKLVNDNGMVFLSSHVYHCLPDPAGWDDAMVWWRKCIKAHKQAGVKYLVESSMDKRGYESLEDLKRYCDYFNVIGEMCNENGIRFGYHNHVYELQKMDGVTRYDYMLQNTDPDKVMFEMDLYWIIKGGKNPVDYFKKYPGRFELWHVKDEKELGCTNGIINFRPIFKAAETAGMQHYIIEVERYNYPPIESVKKSLDFLRKASYTR